MIAAWLRKSPGSSDESEQLTEIQAWARRHGHTVSPIVFRMHNVSASKGQQDKQLIKAVEGIERGEYQLVVAVHSSRFDRRDDTDADFMTSLLIRARAANGNFISVREPQWAKTDLLGKIVSAVAEHANAEKSRTIKGHTWNKIRLVIQAKAFHGGIPFGWTLQGDKYAKQAVCVKPDAIADIFSRVANGESRLSVARQYGISMSGLRRILTQPANYTGIFKLEYTDPDGQTHYWDHVSKSEPPVSADVYHRVQKIIQGKANPGGRPVGSLANWLSGLLYCPRCGAKLYVTKRQTGTALRCGGRQPSRKACEAFKPVPSDVITAQLDQLFAGSSLPVWQYTRVAGNQHQLEELQATLDSLTAKLGTIKDRAERRECLEQIESAEDAIDGFTLEPDRFSHKPSGETIGSAWKDLAKRRDIIKYAVDTYGLRINDAGELFIADTAASKTSLSEQGFDYGWKVTAE